MSVGLDLSGLSLRSLRRHGNRLLARACRTVYAVVRDDPARRTLFAERGVPFAEFGSNLILFGDAAEEWSSRLRVAAIPLLANGKLHIEDRVIRQVITSMIEAVLPIPEMPGDDCCLTLPGGLDAMNPATAEFVAQIVRQCRYTPRIAGPGLAVVLAELSQVGVSGIGIYLGESRCEFSIVRQGRELSCFEISRGMKFIPVAEDMEIADLLREIFATAAFEMNRRPEWKALIHPVALAVAGELALQPGLIELLPICIQHASWPFAIGTVKIPDDFPWTVSRGCLIQAELEALTAIARPAA